MHSHDFSAEPQEAAVLSRLLRVIRVRKWFMTAAVVIAVAAAVAISLLLTPQYRATAQIMRQQTNLDRALFGTQIFELSDVQRELQTGATMVKKREVAEKVKEQLGWQQSIEALLEMVSVSPSGQTNLIDITAVSSDPQTAADVANAFAAYFIEYRREVDRGIVESARKTIQDELGRLSPADARSQKGIMLAEKVGSLQILEEMQTGGYEEAQTAEIPASPYRPRLVLNITLALLGGLLLATVLAFLLESLDRRIKNEETLAHEFGLPVLASVPEVGRRRKRTAKGSPFVGFSDERSPVSESFRTLRSNLRYFETDGRVGTILITSAHPEEGKTLTTVNLALSLALSGARVCVMEADLRRPTIDRHFGLSREVGVSSVLAGTHTFAEAAQIVQIDEFVPAVALKEGRGGAVAPLRKNLCCLTSGPLPPNPAELVGSARMGELLATAIRSADYVLVDSPPLLLVADTLALVGQVGSVLVAARINRTTIDDARQVRTLLNRIKAPTLGVVATGVRRSRGYYYRYAYSAEAVKK